jgi:hypothetical protein
MHVHDFDKSDFSKLDWEQEYTFNASFLHFSNLDLVEKYSKYAVDYITNPYHQSKRYYDYLAVRILFTVQYLLSTVSKDYNTKYLINDIYTPDGDWSLNLGEKSNKNDNKMFHLWHDKITLHNELDSYDAYMIKLLQELKQEFPEYLDKVMDILYPLSKWKITANYDFTNQIELTHNDSMNYISLI